MSPDNANNDRKTLKVSRNRWRRIGSIQSLAIVVLSIGVLYQIIVQRTVISPPFVRATYEVGVGYANKEYLVDMADYVAETLLTTSPEKVDFNHKRLLKMVDPDEEPETKKLLDAAAIRIKQNRISTVWIPKTQAPNERDLSVRFSGVRKTYISDKLTSEPTQEYVVKFKTTLSGQIYVKEISEIVKNSDPNRIAGGSN